MSKINGNGEINRKTNFLARGSTDFSLYRWPYVYHAIEDSLDTKLIEGRGRELLYQGLIDKQIVAFIGSGLSQAYGLLSWSAWMNLQLEIIDKHATALLKFAVVQRRALAAMAQIIRVGIQLSKSAESEPPCQTDPYRLAASDLEACAESIGSRIEALQRLHSAFKDVKADGTSIGGDLPPIKFQVAEQLHNLLRDSRKMLRDNESFFFRPEGANYMVRYTNPELDSRSPPDPIFVGRVEFREYKEEWFPEVYELLLPNVHSVPTPGLAGALEHAKDELASVMSGSDGGFIYFEAREDFFSAAGHPITDREFMDVTKHLLVDEVPHARAILEKSLGFGSSKGRGDPDEPDLPRLAFFERLYGSGSGAETVGHIVSRELTREIPGIADKKGKSPFGVLQVFRSDSVKEMTLKLIESTELQDHWKDIGSILEEFVEENIKKITSTAESGEYRGQRLDTKRVFLTPVHRYVVGMMIALWEDPYAVLEQVSFTDITTIDQEARLSLVDEELDPLSKLVLRLGITRYLTTNYDFEIERLFRDRGYRRFTGQESGLNPSDRRTDGLGGTLVDSTFARDRATDLISFSLGEDGADAAVFHLHGSATEDDNLVVTERNYMDLYLRADRYRDTVDDAIRLAFAANPLLFIGLGMDETDVLRPLRQFMSNRDRPTERPAVALFPALQDSETRTKNAATLYLRYGVHTVYYGDATVQVSDEKRNQQEALAGSEEKRGEPKDESIPFNFDWLHRANSLVQELKTQTQAMLEILEAFQSTDGLKERCGLRKELTLPAEMFNTADQSDSRRDIVWDQLTAKVGRVGVQSPLTNSVDSENQGYDSVCGLQLLFGRLSPRNEKSVAPSGSLEMPVPLFEDSVSRAEHSGVDPYLRFERKLLAELLTMHLKPLGPHEEDWTSRVGEVNSLISEGETTEVKKRLGALQTDQLFPNIRDLRARLVALDGIATGLVTGAICATLDRLEADWDKWWLQWRMSPPHRQARFQIEPLRKDKEASRDSEIRSQIEQVTRIISGEEVALPVCHVRHNVDSVITDFRTGPMQSSGKRGWITFSPVSDKQELEPTHIRTFDNFLAAIQARTSADLPRLSLGRRYHLVAAHRGLGKGSFMQAFETPAGLSQYIASSWPVEAWIPWADADGAVQIDAIESSGPKGEKGKKFAAPNYLTAIFVNLSFSSEIASVFDSVIWSLSDHCAALEWIESGTDLDNLRAYFEKIEIAKGILRSSQLEFHNSELEELSKKFRAEVKLLPRLRATEYLLNTAKRLSDRLARHFKGEYACQAPLRLLLVFNAAELLFTQDGRPKSREIREYFELLTQDRIEHVPMDLVIICNEDYLGPPLVRMRDEADQNCAGLMYVPLVRRNIKAIGASHVQRREERSGIDLMFRTRWLAEKDREGLEEPASLPDQYSTSKVCGVYFARAMRPERFLVDNYRFLAGALHINYLKREAYEKIESCKEIVAREFSKKFLEKLEHETGEFRKWRDDQSHEERNRMEVDSDIDIVRREGQKLTEFRDKTDLLLQTVRNLELNWRRDIGDLSPDDVDSEESLGIREWLVNRIDLNADNASFYEWRQVRSVLSGSRFCMTVLLAAAERIALSGQDVFDAAERAEQFIRRTADRVSALGDWDRESAIISDVLDSYETFNRAGMPQNDIELQLLVLRHLAVIGTPSSLDVLVRVPEIHAYFGRQKAIGRSRPRTRQLLEAVTALARRGLVFRIDPHPRLIRLEEETMGDAGKVYASKDRRRKAEMEYRYVLHRLTQLHVVRKMGADPWEYGELNNFAPTLFASMPAELPRLTMDAYRFLRTLVQSLSQYPDRSRFDTGSEFWVFDQAPLETKVQALRAAFSIVRSTFSVAVVSRFDDYAKEESESHSVRHTHNAGGYFEAYRIQTRWIIRKAWELLDSREREIDKLRDFKPEGPFQQINALYRDEVVWLHNECGVICLVQGILRDAAQLLRQAISLNKEIEGQTPGGPQHNRISLNLAIVQLERGRLQAARRRLLEIQESEQNSSKTEGRTLFIVRGYLGLIEHLSGNPDVAHSLYEGAISGLRQIGDTRAVSVFLRHRGALYRIEKDFSKAQECVSESLSQAEAGGHEDMHRITRLAEIKQERAFAQHEGRPANVDWFSRLERIEEYAEVMEMPVLVCETSTVRAELLLDQGEATLAGQLLTNAMAIARRHDMRLRLNAAMTLYARLLSAKNNYEEASRMLAASLALAKRCRNQLEIHRVERQMEGYRRG